MIDSTPQARAAGEQTWAQQHNPFERIGFWGWIGMYVTGVLLIFLVFAHFFMAHGQSAVPITAQSIWKGLQSPAARILDLSLLVLAVVHGLLGTRRIILDCEILRHRGQVWLDVALCIIGTGIVAFGYVLFVRLAAVPA